MRPRSNDSLAALALEDARLCLAPSFGARLFVFEAATSPILLSTRRRATVFDDRWDLGVAVFLLATMLLSYRVCLARERSRLAVERVAEQDQIPILLKQEVGLSRLRVYHGRRMLDVRQLYSSSLEEQVYE
jgi:hypothetical protein